MKFFIKALLVLLCFTQLTFAASDQYLVEDNLTKLGQTTLDAMFGEGNFIVRARVKMTEAKYSVKYTQESNPKRTSKKDSEEVYILPGVPALKNISPDSLNQLPFDSVTTMAPPKISRILVTVLVDKSYPKSQARKATEALKEVLGLREGRGDDVKLLYKPFYEDPTKDTQQITLIPGEEKLLTFQNGFYALLLLLLIVSIKQN